MTTSARHTEILNAYQSGESRFYTWAKEHFADLKLLTWSRGRTSMLWTIGDAFVMPDGVVFGGHIAAVADHVAGLLTMTTLDDSADRFRTSRLETNFFRPLMKPTATIDGRVVNASKSLIHLEADFFNAEGKLAAKIVAVQSRKRSG